LRPAVTLRKKVMYQLRAGLFRVRVLVSSRGHFPEKKVMYQLRPGLFRARVLVASRGHFPEKGYVSVASRVV
jgi:hypothetical protein